MVFYLIAKGIGSLSNSGLGGASLHIVVEHSRDQGARPTLMEGYNYCITCYLGIITVNEEEGYLLPTIVWKITCRRFN